MKRAALAAVILVSGLVAFGALRYSAHSLEQELGRQQSAWQSQTQQLAGLELQSRESRTRLDQTRMLLSALPAATPLTQLEDKILSGEPLQNLSAAEARQLFAELGFNWNTTGDYIVVRKKSLEGISFDALKGVNLTAAARAVLAITPVEQASVETLARQLADARANWVKEHLQRSEPDGSVLAKYSLPEDADFARSQMALFTNGITAALGDQRAYWLKEHALDWTIDSGLYVQPIFSGQPAPPSAATLTVVRINSGDDWHLNFTLQRSGGSMSAGVMPWQPFPEAFRPAFPGGWPELAQREGFELPRAFQMQTPPGGNASGGEQ